MPCKCCVPRCRGNYTVDTKVHVFKFPRDQTLRNAWIRAVPREDLSVTENSRVSFLSGRALLFHCKSKFNICIYSDKWFTSRTLCQILIGLLIVCKIPF